MTWAQIHQVLDRQRSELERQEIELRELLDAMPVEEEHGVLQARYCVERAIHHTNYAMFGAGTARRIARKQMEGK